MTGETPQMIVITDRGGPSFLVRIIWYIFIGWWLSGLAIGLGWFLAVTVIGLPLAFMLFNRIPAIMTLRGRTVTYESTVKDGVTYLKGRNPDQRPLLVRAIWFVLIGWWLGGLWMFLSWVISLPIITLPLGIWMMNRVGGVMTLLRY
ncbi:MAG TPA: YccF domain-containing protein [Candidatus Limnocylindria bacterium]|nr:YccF domain-containing protein [Candidatus Limnocylindria bacterium]